MSYYTYADDLGDMTLVILKSEGELIGSTTDEEYNIHIYQHGGNYYALNVHDNKLGHINRLECLLSGVVK